MPKLLLSALALINLLVITACTAWYKPGADEEDLTMEQQRCEKETNASSGQAFIDCMEAAGWHHSNISGTASAPDAESTGDDGVAKPRRVGGWYQVGPGSNPLEDAKAHCHEAGVGSEAYYECMEGEGWNPVGIRLTVEEPGDTD
jgi:hypothetical protein